MKRVITALAGGAVVATVAYASASALPIGGGALQVGTKSATCDTNGVKVNWGLETDNNLVYNVAVSDIAAACNGANLFVKVNGGTTQSTVIDDSTVKIRFASPLSANDVDNVKVWIEG
jgi:hypothetical protein